MKDYKNVKVPRAYRARGARTNVKRVSVGRGPRREPSGLMAALIRIMVVVLVTGGCCLGWHGYQWAAHSRDVPGRGCRCEGRPASEQGRAAEHRRRFHRPEHFQGEPRCSGAACPRDSLGPGSPAPPAFAEPDQHDDYRTDTRLQCSRAAADATSSTTKAW